MTPRRQRTIRPTTIEPFPSGAPGSVVITQGRTTVLCTASVAEEVPPWLIDRTTGEARQGWVTAEYAMLPGSTPQRKKRGADSRATEIQRFVGRCLRAAVDLTKMPGLTVTCDCDVIVADGGTRTAAVTGAFVALARALAAAQRARQMATSPLVGSVAAISVGLVGQRVCLDLDYEQDAAAEVDMNVAMDERSQFIEIQATGERGVLRREQLEQMLDLAGTGIRQLLAVQRRALRGTARRRSTKSGGHS